jgi:hypothetical protein
MVIVDGAHYVLLAHSMSLQQGILSLWLAMSKNYANSPR